MKLLIIEDQQFCSDLFCASFPQYPIIVAKTGAEAITSYQTHKPDMVFLDIGLPDISGFEVLKRLREINPNANFIMLSALNNEAYIKKAKN